MATKTIRLGTTFFLFLAIVATITCIARNPKLQFVLISEPLQINEKESWVAFTRKPTFIVLPISVSTVETIRTAISLLHTAAGVNLVHLSLIPTSQKHRIRRRDVPRLCTATRQPLQSDGLTYLCFGLGRLSSQNWFRTALHLAVDILPGTTFICRFVGAIFPAERKFVPSKFQLIAMVARKPRNTEVNVVDWSTTEVKEPEQVAENMKTNSKVFVAPEVVL